MYNAAEEIPLLFSAIFSQTLQPNEILIMDSSSTDQTRELLKQYPVTVKVIAKKEFDHGGTRQFAMSLVKADIYIFMTQDAIPASNDTFKNIVAPLLQDSMIGCAYGKQLPKADANPLSAHARDCNYPDTSNVKSLADKDRYGIKTCFNSNSFAAYRRDALEQVGGFPRKNITAEDFYVAAKLLLAHFKIAYVTEAPVYHSHNFSVVQEFHRYFSIGVFHQQNPWILQQFGTASSDGWKFVKSEINYLARHKKLYWLPRALVSTLIKYFAYQLGLHQQKIPMSIKKNWGINKNFW